jgi:hypothetical protein
MVKKLCGFVISSMLITAFFAAISSSNVGLLSQKALAQDNNNNKTADSTNNMANTIATKADSMMMENKTTANVDTLMTKIRNMGNASIGGSSGSSTVNMTNASTASNMMIGNKSG